MAVRDIIVSIGGDTTQLRRELKKSTSEVRSYGNKVAANFAKAAAAAAAAAAAMGVAIATKSAAAGKELTSLSLVANATVSTFQGLAHGSRQYGIEADKLGDILKDMNDRVGDFNATGGGPMADFFENIAPKVGITADEFKRLSGPEALQAYYNALEQANLSQQDMTFYMESMASDATALIPLLKDNGKGFAEAAKEAEQLGLIMSDLEVEQLNQMGNSIQEIESLFGSLTNQLGAEMAPFVQALVEQFKDATKEAGGFGKVAETVMDNVLKSISFVIDAVHGFKVALKGAQLVFQGVGVSILYTLAEINKGWSLIFAEISGGMKWLAQQANRISPIKIPTDGIDSFTSAMNASAHASQDMQNSMTASLAQTRQELHDMAMETMPSVHIEEWAEKAKAAAKEVAEAGLAARGMGTGEDPQGQGGNVVDFDSARLDKLREQYATEQELLLEKLEAEREILNEARADKAIDEEEWQALQLAAKENYEQGLTDIEQAAANERTRIAEQEAANRRAVMDGMMTNLASLMNSGSKKMFEVGKKASLAQATVAGIEAAVNSYAAGAKVGGPILGAAYAATSIAATSAKISAIKSQSFGSSGSQAAQASAARSGGATAQTIPQQQQQSQQNIFVQGLNPNQMFSGQQLIDIINRGQEEGGVLRVGGM